MDDGASDAELERKDEKEEAMDLRNMALLLMIDNSASMEGNPLIDRAYQLVCAA